MLTKARADELAANLDREERVIDKLRGRIALIESLDRGETGVEEARRELAAARADAGI